MYFPPINKTDIFSRNGLIPVTLSTYSSYLRGIQRSVIWWNSNCLRGYTLWHDIKYCCGKTITTFIYVKCINEIHVFISSFMSISASDPRTFIMNIWGGSESYSSASSNWILYRMSCKKIAFWVNASGHSQRTCLIPSVEDTEHTLQYWFISPGIAIHAFVNILTTFYLRSVYISSSRHGVFWRMKLLK